MTDRRCAWCGRSLSPWYVRIVLALQIRFGKTPAETHGICPPCAAKLISEMKDTLAQRRNNETGPCHSGPPFHLPVLP